MKSLFRNVCFAALTALCAVVLAGCEDDDTKSGDLQLFYPTVVDIGPSMNFVSGTPTYYGPAPSNFSIAGITLDDKSVATECFSIGADTGMVSISNTDDLEPRYLQADHRLPGRRRCLPLHGYLRGTDGSRRPRGDRGERAGHS